MNFNDNQINIDNQITMIINKKDETTNIRNITISKNNEISKSCIIVTLQDGMHLKIWYDYMQFASIIL